MFATIFYAIFLSEFALAVTNFNVSINTANVVNKISDRFISFTLDCYQVGYPDWNGMNFTSLEPLAKALGPSYYRFGGTDADFLTFQELNSYEMKAPYNITNNTISGAQFDQLYNFTKNVGWRLIFDLNQMLRTADNQWNSTNAQLLINYTSSKGYDFDFELGNEPEYYANNFNGFNLTGAQVAAGYRDLRNLLNSNSLYNNSKLIGPSVNTELNFKFNNVETGILYGFLNNSGGNYVNALSFHHYYVNGHTAQPQDFLNITIMDYFKGAVSQIRSIKNSFPNYTNVPLWLGETSTAYNSGAPNISNTYLNGFLWLDKLGLAALNEVEVVLRQDFWGLNYSLVDDEGNPNPDYWLNFLYKKLVGQQVYNITTSPADPNLRLYAGSSANNNGTVLYGFRLSNESFTIDLPGLSSKQVTLYVLQTSDNSGNLQSKSSKLNGNLIEWTPGANIPDLTTKGNITNLPITLPGYSQFFIVTESLGGSTTSNTCPNPTRITSVNILLILTVLAYIVMNRI